MKNKLPEQFQSYEEVLERYKEALKGNIRLTLSDFCRSNGVVPKYMDHWLERHQLVVEDIRKEICELRGLNHEDYATTRSELYEKVWEGFKAALRDDYNAKLSDICKVHKVNPHAMNKWLSRKNLSVADLKIEMKLTASVDTRLNPEAIKHFRKTLDRYKKVLLKNPTYKLREHCMTERVNYTSFRRWMKDIGITETELKKSARFHCQVPNSTKMCFVQFKPNGGSNSDHLKGVLVKMPDGTCVTIEECTVLSLCSFINIYSKPKK